MRTRGVLGALAAGACLVAPGAAPAAPGDLDGSFGEHGVTSKLGYVIGEPVTTADGGVAFLEERSDQRAIVKLDAGGRLDPSFGSGGRFIPTGSFKPSSLATGPAGSLYVGGTENIHTPASTVAVARLLADGELDPAFGTGGTARVPAAGAGAGGAVAAADDGVVIGVDGPEPGVALAKLGVNGGPDTGFGNGGISESISGVGVPFVRTHQSGYLLGTQEDGVGVKVARYDASGELVQAFANGGVQTIPGSTPARLSALAVGPAGQFAVVYGFDPLTAKIRPPNRVAGFGPDGERLPGFDPSAALSRERSSGRSLYPSGATYDARGRLILSGAWYIDHWSWEESDPALARLRLDGGPDPSFGEGGLSIFPAAGLGVDSLPAVASGPPGRIVASGFGFEPETGAPRSAVARLLTTLSRHDADADGLRDKRDACPRVHSTRKGGCPRIRVSLKARRAGDGIAGKVAGERGCFVERLRDGRARTDKLLVVRKQRGPDKRVGRVRIRARDLEWSFDVRRPGAYYARYRTTVKPDLGLCRAARSKVVRIR